MRIVCDGCSAKYAVGDDKLVGKVFKIRCKKCSRVMVVRGVAPPQVEAAEPGRADWYFVVDGLQLGPFERAELMRRRADGELDDDTYVWREGFAEWQTFAATSELAAEPLPVATEKLRGERNETSVLFTLSSLAQLAAPKPAPVEAGPSPMLEGSGLIDIRTLARTYAPARPAPSSAVSSELIPLFAQASFEAAPAVLVPVPRARDRRLVLALAAALGLFAAAAIALVAIVVRGEPPAESAPANKAAALATAPGPLEATMPAPVTSGVGSASTASGDAPERASGSRDATSAAGGARSAPEARDASSAAGRDPSAREAGGATGRDRLAPAARGSSSAGRDPSARDVASKESRARASATDARRAANARASTPDARRTAAAAPADSCDEITCALNANADPCCDRLRRGVPDALDRDAVARGIRTISAKACRGAGDVKLSIKVGADGRVTSATPVGSPDPALAACVADAARKGSFARTQRGGSFAYVWRF